MYSGKKRTLKIPENLRTVKLFDDDHPYSFDVNPDSDIINAYFDPIRKVVANYKGCKIGKDSVHIGDTCGREKYLAGGTYIEQNINLREGKYELQWIVREDIEDKNLISTINAGFQEVVTVRESYGNNIEAIIDDSDCPLDDKEKKLLGDKVRWIRGKC